MRAVSLLLVGALACQASAQSTGWGHYLGKWQTASKPAYQDMFHVELLVVRLQKGYELTWTQHFATHEPRQLRRATLVQDTDSRWRYSATGATGRTREGAAWFGLDGLRFEYREHDPSGRSARIFETFMPRDTNRMETTRMIWRSGGWQPLTAESWWRVDDHPSD